jgi:RecA/RadA recombinase
MKRTRTKGKSLVEQIEESANKPAKTKIFTYDDLIPYTKNDLVPTGSTMLNLSMSDMRFGGFCLGTLANLIGDSSAGKSFLGYTCLAECANQERFDEYKLIHDDIEDAISFNRRKLFGTRATERIQAPFYYKNGRPGRSSSVEALYGNIMNLFKKKDPFILFVDSFDGLMSKEDEKRADEFAKMIAKEAKQDDDVMAMDEAIEKEVGKEQATKMKGSYGTGKARLASEMLRVITGKVFNTRSLVVIISQTRDNLNAGMFGSTKTRSGGKALKFYCYHEIWLSILKTHTKKNRAIGVETFGKVEKNRLTGKKRNFKFPIFYDYGVDDIGSMIDFLVEEKFWKKSDGGAVIHAVDFDEKMKKHNLIEMIEKDNLENKLRRITEKAWHKIEDSLKLNRKAKYE